MKKLIVQAAILQPGLLGVTLRAVPFRIRVAGAIRKALEEK